MSLIRHSLCPWISLYVRGQNKTNCTIKVWWRQLQKKKNMMWPLEPSKSYILQSLMKIFSFWVTSFFWSKVLTYVCPFFRSSTSLLASLALLISLIHVHTLLSFNIWSCILEHILAYPIVFQYFVIIKTLEKLYKDNFVPIVHFIPFPHLCSLFVIAFAVCLSQRALEPHGVLASWSPCLWGPFNPTLFRCIISTFKLPHWT
jgi:hypothetical protein